MERYPFAYNPSQPFIAQAAAWIADVLYDILPDKGFELRDEQIYMAYQLERAFAEKQTIFAEAGVGTGKTIVYLLYAILFARYTRQPAIIACADESLIEQLVKPEGDIAKLAQHLELTIDARLSKSPDQYLCLNKLEESRLEENAQVFQQIHKELPDFVNSRKALQSFYPYGDRKQYAHLDDEQWKKVGWDAFQDCSVCERRHRCGQTLSRDHYRKAADLIICSHDFYMLHVWTYEGRVREGQLPLLPAHSSVIFDEGHLLEAAAQKGLTYKFKHEVFEEILIRLLNGEIRESLAWLIEDAMAQSEALFARLERQSKTVPGSERREIMFNEALQQEVTHLKEIIAEIEEELVFEAELFTLDEYHLRIVEEHLEMIQRVLELFEQPDNVVSWVVEEADGLTLVVMPRMVKEVLKERVFSREMPIIFSSATLSHEGKFNYLAGDLGIEDYLSFSAASPFDYEHQMEVVIPKLGDPGDAVVGEMADIGRLGNTVQMTAQMQMDKKPTDKMQTDKMPMAGIVQADKLQMADKMQEVVRLLVKMQGRTLLLFPSREEMKQFREALVDFPELSSMRFVFEGDREVSQIISAFQNDELSSLCAFTLWEGLDVPGSSLSQVIIWSLPFPPNDPVFAAKRKRANAPFEEVDLPYMLLRLRQGVGRLIRTREDRGIVAIFGQELSESEAVRSKVLEALPQGAEIKPLL